MKRTMGFSSRLSRWEATMSRVTWFRGAQFGAWVGGIGIVLMALIVFGTVLLRRSPLGGGWMIGGIEITMLLMAMVSVCSIAYCWYLGGHIRIGIIRERIRSLRKLAALDAFATFMALPWILAATFGLWQISMENMRIGGFTRMLYIPEAPFMIIFTIVMGHFFFVLLRSFLGFVAKASGRPVEHNGLY
ncbi:TRAP transporter small permease subunit [Chloroflexota bacterium]